MVPWDRTPAGIGSPGVRVLYGMKNGKAGMMLTIRDYRAEDLADAAAHLECHCGTGGQLPGRCGFAAGGSGPLLPFPDQDGGGAGRRRTGGSLCPPSEQHRPVFAHRQRLLWGEGGAQRPGHWTGPSARFPRERPALGFRGLQFNAVVAENAAAIALYEQLGFVRLGTVPGGYRRADGRYVDTYIYFHDLRG